jgi:hypothetical protein
MTLTVYFTETFQGETVTLGAGDGPQVRVEGLRTDLRTGKARTVQLEPPPGASRLTARLEGGGEAALDLGGEALAFVTVELSPDGLRLVPVTKTAYAAQPTGFA